VRLIGKTLAVVCCVACGPSEEEVIAKSADSIVAIAKADRRVYRGTLGGRALALMVHECKVYNLEDAPRKGGKRPSVLEPEFYPWPTVCSRQAIEADTAWVTVHLGRTGLGAGGCCATGGAYRSRDGRVWEREGQGGAWKRVGSDSAQAR
jgi:hypothetical protein